MSQACRTPTSSGSSELVRLPGWEARLAVVIESAAHRPYQLGEHDCFRFACDAVRALTGAELWEAWRGRYRTKRRALRLLVEYGGDFTNAFSRLFGSQPIAMTFARRGDIAEYCCPQGEQHLGVVQGACVALLLERGVGTVPLLGCAHAWRIG